MADTGAKASPVHRRRPLGPFHLKDVFTLVNLVSGVLAVRWVFVGEPMRAGYAVIVGYLLGDGLDGAVARLTNTSNAFGAELDSISDHFVHVVVPGLILYTVYADAGHPGVGMMGMGALVITATIRHARLAAARFDFPLCWLGLPRTVSGFAAMALPLSKVFNDHIRGDYWAGLAVIVFLSALNLVPIPYMTHRGQRAMQPWVKVFVVLFIVSPIVTFAVDRAYVFDVFAFWVLGSAVPGWLPVHRDERREFYAEYRRWRSVVTG